MELLLGVLVVLAAVAFVAVPLVRGRRPEPAATVTAPAAAEQRAAIYRELLDLELDHRVGKVAEPDFREVSDALLARAAALIAEEDARAATAQEQVEQEIAAMRQAIRASRASSTTERRS